MKYSFINWYSQAFGATLGIIACIYSYLSGYMLVFNNIGRYFDSVGFNGIIGSYLLLPLCILTLLLAVIRSNCISKDKNFISLDNLNRVIQVLTIVVGFLGSSYYFTIPAIFIMLSIYLEQKQLKNRNNEVVITEKIEDMNEGINKNNNIEHTFLDEKNGTLEDNLDLNKDINTNGNPHLLSTKKEIAKELLIKEANKQFIMDITGFSLDELDRVEEEIIEGTNII